jgi:hypothetical protein
MLALHVETLRAIPVALGVAAKVTHQIFRAPNLEIFSGVDRGYPPAAGLFTVDARAAVLLTWRATRRPVA